MILSRNFSDSSLMGELSQDGVNFDISTHTPIKTGHDPKRLYKWEIIPRDTYALIHTFPDNRLRYDMDALLKKADAAKVSCIMNLSGRAYLLEWLGSYDLDAFGKADVNSFCISFKKVYNWIALCDFFLTDLQRDFYKRLGIHP
jgi:hypothetical protein